MTGFVGKARSAGVRAVAPLLQARERWQKSRLYTSGDADLDPAVHLHEAAQWLCRAQDHGADRGVSYGCVLGQEFLDSYPETTGYIICTFLNLARRYRDERYLDRAIQMGNWETAIQMDCGAAGMYAGRNRPAIFDTGMVLLGWAALHRETNQEIFCRSMERAGQWMAGQQEPNGHWIRGNDHGLANATSTVYNVKAAWGLAEAGVALGIPAFVDAAVKNAEYTLSKQLPNGWFDDCCLSDRERPLLHTIAYAMQGLIGIGRIAGRSDFIDGARRTADALLELMDEGGFIPGRIDHNFRGAAGWCCLTGTAQTSVVWSDLERAAGDARYGQAADRANAYLMARHDISSGDPAIRGGVPGSWPVWGDYRQYMILNWATKFFADALLMRAAAGHSR